MKGDLEKAERTAVDAAKAMITVFDFASSVLEELVKAVEDILGLKVGKYDRYRLSTQDAQVIKRYTNPRSKGESRVQRYIYSLFSPVKRSEDEHLPFLLISLVNAEDRPPAIVYGTVQRISGKEKSDKDFCEYFLLWVNEQLNKICRREHQRKYGWEVTHELAGKAEANKLTARVSLYTTNLFDIDKENLSDRAKTIAQWFSDRLGLTPHTEG